VLDGLGDLVPGIGEKEIVDAPVRQRERRHFDYINELARFDD
jgi:hypothetical protein